MGSLYLEGEGQEIPGSFDETVRSMEVHRSLHFIQCGFSHSPYDIVKSIDGKQDSEDLTHDKC